MLSRRLRTYHLRFYTREYNGHILHHEDGVAHDMTLRGRNQLPRTIHGSKRGVHGPHYGILTKSLLWDARHYLQPRQKLLVTVYKARVIRVTIIVWQIEVIVLQ